MDDCCLRVLYVISHYDVITFNVGEGTTESWHHGELKQRNVWSLTECNQLFFASQEARHKHYLAYHKGSDLPAANQHV